MKRLAFVGSRHLASQLAQYLAEDPSLRIVGAFDDFRAAGETTGFGPILGRISGIGEALRAGTFDEAVFAIGYRDLAARGRVLEELCAGIPLHTFIHPTAWVHASAGIGKGAIILPRASIDAGASIGAGTLLNVGAIVCHDTKIGPNCFLGPGSTVAGFVSVEAGCFVGAGATLIDGITLASGVAIGAGAVVTEDLRGSGLYLGVPARKVR